MAKRNSQRLSGIINDLLERDYEKRLNAQQALTYDIFKVYKCKDNIEFILSDYLKMYNSDKFNNKVDYVFLSPPWGGPDYKDTEIYSITNMMHQSIYDIIKTSLKISRNIIFYLPKNLNLIELFKVITKIKNEEYENSGNNLNFDVRVLKCGTKIKTLLILFGQSIQELMTKKDFENYLSKYYKYVKENIDYLYSNILYIGIYRFFRLEYNYREYLMKNSNLYYLGRYIQKKLMKR